MKTSSKKILTSCLALMMAVIMALPTFALTVGSTRKIYGWNGQTVNGSKAALTSMGYNSRVQVRTGDAGNQQWTIKTSRFGDYVIQNNDGYYLNIYRVAYPAVGNFVYYYATSYVYEDNLNGYDQRVKLPTVYGKTGYIQLAQPQVSSSGSVSKNWYLMADKSSASTLSDVIWYGDHSMSKAQWVN